MTAKNEILEFKKEQDRGFLESLLKGGENSVDRYEKFCGKKFKEIKITDYRDILSGQDLERAKRKEASSNFGYCHHNAAMAVCSQPFEDWEVSFCEGLYGENSSYPHCWNKLTNKKSGEEYYVDFTIGEGPAMLLNEWDNKDIIKLFDVTRMSFVPFRDFWKYVDRNKRAKAILSKYFKVG